MSFSELQSMLAKACDQKDMIAVERIHRPLFDAIVQILTLEEIDATTDDK